jgi:hypothetical protein
MPLRHPPEESVGEIHATGGGHPARHGLEARVPWVRGVSKSRSVAVRLKVLFEVASAPRLSTQHSLLGTGLFERAADRQHLVDDPPGGGEVELRRLVRQRRSRVVVHFHEEAVDSCRRRGAR